MMTSKEQNSAEIQAPEGKFKLAEIKLNANLPGISRQETEHHIEVTYQNRFALFDEAQKISRPVV